MNVLKMEWSDNDLWRKLAKHHGVRLVSNTLPADPTNIKKVCEVLGISIDGFKDWAGIDKLVPTFRTLKDFNTLNPSLPAFALQWQLLEMMYEIDINNGVFNL